LTAIAVAWASRRAGLQNRETWGAKRSCLGLAIPSSAIQMPHDCIDWIESAGNYIEVHGDGRTMLLRMTLRQAAESLGSASFVQIHRSILVNRERIAKLDRAKRPHHVRLIDGTLLKVGESYRLTNV
jgi:DNA-binding LytR/AlgR family response regulator